MLRRRFLAFALLTAVACSGGSSRSAKYPRRAPGCPLAMYNGLPDTKVWDDIGPAEVGCYLDESEIACLGRLRVEACRMGGDIVYNVPKKAMRPMERGMVYRAMVAHTRDVKKTDEAPAPVDAGSGAVEPLLPAAGASAVTTPATDGGGQ